MPRGARLHSFGGLGLRAARARPLRSLLTALGIVLGVGMVFGVLILVTTIHSTFDNLFDAIYGRTDLIVSGRSSIGSVPEDTLPKVRRVEGVEAATGTVNGVFRVVDERGQVSTGRSSTLFVAGIDFNGPDTSGAETVAGREPVGDGEIELEEGWAKQKGLEVGNRIRLATPTGLAAMRISGFYRLATNLDLGGYGTAAMPVSAARRLTDKYGTWDEVDVIVAGSASVDAVQRRIDAVTGRGVEVTTPAGKGEEANEQLSGLDIVLYFFSGMALFVGAFLILNSFNMTVLQRLREIGTLRALGASRRRITTSVVSEALILAAVGSLLGLGLGVGLAELLAAAMRDLFGLPISSLEVTAPAAIVAVIVGLLATIAGSLYPALRAGRIAPIRALTGGGDVERQPGWRRALAGLALFLPGLAVGGLFLVQQPVGWLLVGAGRRRLDDDDVRRDGAAGAFRGDAGDPGAGRPGTGADAGRGAPRLRLAARQPAAHLGDRGGPGGDALGRRRQLDDEHQLHRLDLRRARRPLRPRPDRAAGRLQRVRPSRDLDLQVAEQPDRRAPRGGHGDAAARRLHDPHAGRRRPRAAGRGRSLGLAPRRPQRIRRGEHP